MIKIKKDVYNQLKSMNHIEECGFVVGKNNNIVEIIKVKNTSKHFFEFKMSCIDKLKSIIRMILKLYNFCVIYHVHSIDGELSIEDLKHAITGMIYLVICKRKLNFFKIVKADDGIACEKEKYEII